MYFTLSQDYVHGHHSREDSLTIARNVLGAHLPDGRFLSDVEVSLEVQIIQAAAYAMSPGNHCNYMLYAGNGERAAPPAAPTPVSLSKGW
jgi:hypothetical protein